MAAPLMTIPQNWRSYVICAVVLAGGVRLLMSVARATEYHFPPRGQWRSDEHRNYGFFHNLVQDFFGIHGEFQQRDWGQTYFLGLFEILAYPLLMKADRWDGIAWWISLKTVPHWKQWLSKGESYVRFFLGNALVLTASYLLAQSRLFFNP